MNASGIWKGMVKGCDRIGTFKFGMVQPLINESNGLEKSKQNAKHRPKSLLQLLRTIGMEVFTLSYPYNIIYTINTTSLYIYI